ncbi:NAD(P)/FAD-dependent oxidoreductase [Streptantibioticus ferralitis]|uniref:FAD-binding oxidoreductase n=1 Tax=Streptantibioticus ferralitis TaxID=236510 RepID=A0ABT5YWT2_9ACTN|nr:FAD-binding oxidoreductase [Streptantibioticus ferralitis]MDF2255928.1 FAD-binding oxidoreductase [Streptantibioticus ferralitis]
MTNGMDSTAGQDFPAVPESVPPPGDAAVVVIGAGVVGAGVAFHLAEAGVRDVLVLDRARPGSGSSGKPIGGVRAQFTDPLDIRLGQRGIAAFRHFAERPGNDVGWDSVGYLFLLGDADEVAFFEDSVAVQNALGVPSRVITPREAHELCPYLDPKAVVAAAYSPADGYALPRAAVAGYLAAAVRLGVAVRGDCAVTGIDTADGVVTAVRTPYGTVRTPAAVCPAGAWSGRVGEMAGVRLPVTPLRRQIAFTGPLRQAPPRIPCTLDFGSTLYFHNDGRQGLLLGISDPRQPPGFDRSFTLDWLPLFRAAAARRAPELAGVDITGGWAGLYEMTPDRNALIGEAPDVRGFLYATGFSGHGFLQAPAVGEIIRDLFLHRTPFIDVAPLAATRFTTSATRPETTII